MQAYNQYEGADQRITRSNGGRFKKAMYVDGARQRNPKKHAKEDERNNPQNAHRPSAPENLAIREQSESSDSLGAYQRAAKATSEAPIQLRCRGDDRGGGAREALVDVSVHVCVCIHPYAYRLASVIHSPVCLHSPFRHRHRFSIYLCVCRCM